LRAKKIRSKDAPEPVGPYSQAVLVGDTLFCSGQIALDPATGVLVGKTAGEQAERALLNLKAVLGEVGCDFSNVVKVTLYLKNMGDFAGVNEVYARYFGENGPARSTVEVSRLPKDALVEIEAVASTT